MDFVPPLLADTDDGPSMLAASMVSHAVKDTASHSHSRGQLLGALQGLLTVYSNDNRWVVPATHAVWIPPHSKHGVHSHGPFAGWSVYITASVCQQLPSTPGVILTSGLLREAIARAATWDTAVMSVAQQRIADVIVDEISHLPHQPLGLPMPQDPRLYRIAQALSDDPANNRTLAEWALWAAVSERTLTRRFSDETGFSFTHWRQRVRLLKSLELLAAGHAVTTIALTLGYDNVSAFIAMFKRTFGVTPTRYLAALSSGT